MTRAEFVRAEAAAARRFVDRYPDPDGVASYTREYRCGCGYRTTDAGELYDHAETCCDECRSNPQAALAAIEVVP